jgi:choice-of-anchor C domain-containing protein
LRNGIIVVGAWKKKYSNVIKLSKPKKLPFSDFVSTESFSCGVAEEFLLLTIVSLLSCIFGNYFLWFALFFAFVLHLVIHFVLCIRFGHYVPGLLTSVIFFPIGILILIAFMIDANFHLISIIVSFDYLQSGSRAARKTTTGGDFMKRLLVLSALLCIAIVSQVQAADIVNNGGFTPSPSGSSTYFSGQSFASGAWMVVFGTVDWVGPTYWQAPGPGQASVDLDGWTVGAIAQTLTTTPGQSYTVTFSLSGNPDEYITPITKYLNVSAGSVTAPFSYTITALNNNSNMLYKTESFTFQATGPSTVLTFASQDGLPGSTVYWGPVIGNVSVNPVPVPPAALLLAPGLLGLAGIRRRFKK